MQPSKSGRPTSIGSAAAKHAGRRFFHVGQAMVEFAFISIVALLILVGAIQFALLGQVALALSQAAYQGARYAAVNTSADQTAVSTYVKSVASPTILNNSGNDLAVAINPNTTPRAPLAPVTVTLTYQTASKVFFKGFQIPSWNTQVFSMPTSLSATETVLSE